MWRTSQGERVLTGGEAAAFKAGLSDLVEDLAEWRHDQSTGVEAFDALSYGQRLALLVDLAGALLNPSVPPCAAGLTGSPTWRGSRPSRIPLRDICSCSDLAAGTG
jgi:hypothetical protein